MYRADIQHLILTDLKVIEHEESFAETQKDLQVNAAIEKDNELSMEDIMKGLICTFQEDTQNKKQPESLTE